MIRFLSHAFLYIPCPIRLFAVWVLAFAATESVTYSQSTKSIVSFESDVLPILKSRCIECHRGAEAKNDFQVLNKAAVLGFVDSSGAANSSLWTDYLMAPSKEEDSDSLMMPPTGRLPTGELATLKIWLDEGAAWPDEVKLDDAVVVTPVATQYSGINKYLSAAGFFHPAVVHFPIALILFAALAVIASYLGGGEGAKRMAYVCFVFGAMTTIVSAFAGWGFAMEKGYVNTGLLPVEGMNESTALLYRHRWLGISTAIVAVLIAMVATVSQRRSSSGHLWRIGVLACAMMVSIVGHQGGEMVYGDILHKAFERLGW